MDTADMSPPGSTGRVCSEFFVEGEGGIGGPTGPTLEGAVSPTGYHRLGTCVCTSDCRVS